MRKIPSSLFLQFLALSSVKPSLHHLFLKMKMKFMPCVCVCVAKFWPTVFYFYKIRAQRSCFPFKEFQFLLVRAGRTLAKPFSLQLSGFSMFIPCIKISFFPDMFLSPDLIADTLGTSGGYSAMPLCFIGGFVQLKDLLKVTL